MTAEEITVLNGFRTRNIVSQTCVLYETDIRLNIRAISICSTY